MGEWKYGLRVFPFGIELRTDGRRSGWRRKQWPGWLKKREGELVYVRPRGLIRAYSPASAKRLAMLVANSGAEFQRFITLTYHGVPLAGESAGKRNRRLVANSKRDLHRFLVVMRDELGRYIWVQEFQTRGAVHFHLLCEGTVSPERVTEAWLRAIGSLGDTAAHLHGVKCEPIRDQRQAGSTSAITSSGKGARQRGIVRESGRSPGRSRGSRSPRRLRRSCRMASRSRDAGGERLGRSSRSSWTSYPRSTRTTGYRGEGNCRPFGVYAGTSAGGSAGSSLVALCSIGARNWLEELPGSSRFYGTTSETHLRCGRTWRRPGRNGIWSMGWKVSGSRKPGLGAGWDVASALGNLKFLKKELRKELEAKEKATKENSYCWSSKDVAKELDVHVKTVDRWRKTLGLPSKKFSRSVRFRPSDVRRWVAQRKEG